LLGGLARNYHSGETLFSKGRASLTRDLRHTSALARSALLVRIAGSLYSFPASAVEEVLPALPLEETPQTPPFVRGAVFVRGQALPVIDAAERLQLAGRKRPLEPPIVCLTLNGRRVGVEVDEAVDLIEWDGGAFAAAADLASRDGFFAGLQEFDGQVVRLLNPERMLTQEETAALPSGSS
jgi:purine-binding chemotaxis protein CheW